MCKKVEKLEIELSNRSGTETTIWNEDGEVEVDGLYPDNRQTFDYIKSLIIKQVDEGR